MAWVIAVLGAALAAGGGIALWSGSGYIRLDWGQAQTVAGTVALSAGVVTIAIAAVLFALRDALRRLALGQLAPGQIAGLPARAGGSASGVGLEAVHLQDAEDAEDAEDGDGSAEADRAVAPFVASSAASSAASPAAPSRGGLVGRLARAAGPRPDRPERVAPTVSAPAPAPIGAREAAPRAPEPFPEPAPRPGAPAVDAWGTSAEAAAPVAAPVAVPEAPRPLAPPPIEAPTVVGRYEANGASYVLFSDGTIEVETDSGTHRFASMAALKDHIERQDAG